MKIVLLNESERAQIEELCRRFRVLRLDVLGSAVRVGIDPKRSDLDFLVEFRPMPSGEYADAFFGLREHLESLFGRPIDLVTSQSLRNPYFRSSVERTRERLYAA